MDKLTDYPPLSMSLHAQLNSTNPINLGIEEIEGWNARNEDDLQVISQKHDELIGIILAEEEDVISWHRTHIDDIVELTKQVEEGRGGGGD